MKTANADDFRRLAMDLLDAAGAVDGEPLPHREAALISLGLAASVTALNPGGMAEAAGRAFASGASLAEVQETLSLVSGLGVHTLMIGCPLVMKEATGAGLFEDAPLDDAQRLLWDKYVGGDAYWLKFEEEFPGFLSAMLRLSSDQFIAFFDYCSVPWRSGAVRARCKELIAMACDATPGHRFLPGARLHLKNALALGVGRRAVLEALDLALEAPSHEGLG